MQNVIFSNAVIQKDKLNVNVLKGGTKMKEWSRVDSIDLV